MAKPVKPVATKVEYRGGPGSISPLSQQLLDRRAEQEQRQRRTEQAQANMAAGLATWANWSTRETDQ